MTLHERWEEFLNDEVAAEEETAEDEYQREQDERLRSYRVDKLFGAVCTFEPKWNHMRFFDEKRMQDAIKESRSYEWLIA